MRAYFDSIDQNRLVDLICDQISDGRVLQLIRDFLEAGVIADGGWEPTKTGVPQGGVASPLWSNIFLTPFDHTMTAAGYRVTRWADDFVDIRERLLAVQEKSGFIPNLFLVLAHRPEEFRAFFAYHDALMNKPGNLSKAEREMIVVATSNANQCQYCVAAHGAILRIRAENPLIADQIAVNYRKADITARQKAMLDFAMTVAFEAYAIGEDDFTILVSHGFDQEDVWDVAAIAAFFGMSNRMANVTSMRPNDEFYALGR